jgi:hypothetical protein
MRMRVLRRISVIGAILGLTGGIAAAAIPGPQRMLAPSAYGLTKIAEGVFTDDPAGAQIQLRLIAQAERTVGRFFGELKASPRYILCTKLECDSIFGGNGSVAKAYGWSAIKIPPKAFSDGHVGEILLTHERMHIELLHRWGLSALWDEKFPNWFNEGLETYISSDTRVRFDHDQNDQVWIRGSRTFWDWGGFVKARGWRDAYGAAASIVAGINARAGNGGIRSIIDRTLAGEKFDKVLAETAGI